jgi:hypothetical protein
MLLNPAAKATSAMGISRFDNQLFCEEDPARLSNSDQRGSKMLPEETPKLTLTDAEPLGQCIDCLAVERALSDERQGS